MKTGFLKAGIIGIVLLLMLFTIVITSCQKEDITAIENNDTNASTSGISLKKPPEVPAIIAMPEGNKPVQHAYATGVQIYQCQQSTTDPGVYLWVFIAPSANLYADENYVHRVGVHYAGPTWEATAGPKKGKKVVGIKLESSPSPDVTAIPWLLLQSVPGAEPDYLDKVTYIQRINTTGGLAPATGADADHPGVLEEVPYTAEYFFYAAK